MEGMTGMTGMTGEIVFVMLVVGIICIAFICRSKIREKESKVEELERKKLAEEAAEKERNLYGTVNRELTVQERNGENTEEGELQELKEKLIGTEKRLWELELKEGYEDFFNKVVMPLQVLLGLAEVPPDTLAADQMEYYLYEVIADPLIQAADQVNGRIVNGILILSESKKEFNQEKIKKDCAYLGKTELENYIQKNERRLESGSIVFRKANVVQGLGSVIEELKKLDQKTLADPNIIGKLAQRVQQLFEKNKIYPMFASDWRLYAYPELKKRYIPINKNSIRYPGLFIEQDGVLDVLGSNIGMDDCEV